MPALAYAPLAGDVAAALQALPSGAGVGQVLGPDGRSLVVGMASNLRRWAATHLGLGKPAPAGRRPKTNLSGIATALGWVETDGAFRQRLAFERLMAPLVPLSARRDLKPPAFLQLDLATRFPRVVVRAAALEPETGYGPFRDRRAAEKARDAVQRTFPLRPCDHAFEPDPALPLGVACLYAQVRSCAAPCLARVGEEEYRELAARAAAWLADPSAREAVPSLPPTVASGSACALVVDAGRDSVGLVPVRAGRVLDDALLVTAAGAIEQAVARLAWPAPGAHDDWPWLTAWLRAPKARAAWLPVRAGEPAAEIAARVRAVLPPRFGDNVGQTRGRA